MQQSTERFSNRVKNYAKYRPTYPKALLWFLANACGLIPSSTVADIGSGTGLLTRLFLDNGNSVYGVEPNGAMRAAAERLLKNYDKFTSTIGQAEATTLPDQSVDFITVGQAFHWFELDPTQQEFQRILRPKGWVVLIWNHRQMQNPFHQDYDQMLRTYSQEYEAVQKLHGDKTRLNDFLGAGTFKAETFDNAQTFDLEGLRGRLLSCSYAPTEDQPEYEPMMARLAEIFDAHETGGRVKFEYQTQVFYGQFSG